MSDSKGLEFPIRVTPSTPDADGNVSLNVEYDNNFREWFMKREGLKRWSEKRFRKVVGPLLQEYYFPDPVTGTLPVTPPPAEVFKTHTADDD